MRNRLVSTSRFVAPALLGFLLACGDGSPSAPDPPRPAADANLAVFTDGQGFETTDVRDVDGEVVRFDLDSGSLVWAASGEAFPDWVVEGNFLGASQTYRVRFGNDGDVRRAYFTETGRGTICDLAISGGLLQIAPTNILPP